MKNLVSAVHEYVSEARKLDAEPSTTEATFYPAIKSLIATVLKEAKLLHGDA